MAVAHGLSESTIHPPRGPLKQESVLNETSFLFRTLWTRVCAESRKYFSHFSARPECSLKARRHGTLWNHWYEFFRGDPTPPLDPVLFSSFDPFTSERVLYVGRIRKMPLHIFYPFYDWNSVERTVKTCVSRTTAVSPRQQELTLCIIQTYLAHLIFFRKTSRCREVARL